MASIGLTFPATTAGFLTLIRTVIAENIIEAINIIGLAEIIILTMFR